MTEMTRILEQLPDEGRISRHNFYVIYLVRDPRAIINSVDSLKEQWPEKFLDPKHICSRWDERNRPFLQSDNSCFHEVIQLLINWKQDWLWLTLFIYIYIDYLMIPLFNQTTKTRICWWWGGYEVLGYTDWPDKIINQIRGHCSAAPATTRPDKSEIQHQPSPRQGPTFPPGSQRSKVGGEKYSE